MQADSKIMEAEFFLSKIRENYRVIPDVTFYFNAFLGSAISILDYLSEDYANEFNLKIPLNVTSFRREFNTKIKNSTDKRIQEFHKWITIERERIEKTDEIGSLLTQKRHRITHRHFEPPGIRVRIRYKTSEHPRAKIKECFVPWFENQYTNSDKRKLEKISPNNVLQRKTIVPIDNKKTVDMAEACVELLNKIKKLVDETEKKFPLTNNGDNK